MEIAAGLNSKTFFGDNMTPKPLVDKGEKYGRDKTPILCSR
jgi:hypothetical protein